jgi:hypothetical protein
MVISIMESGLKVIWKALELLSLEMATNMRGSGLKVVDMTRAFSLCLMEIYTKVTGLTMLRKVLVSINIVKELIMKDHG